MPREAKTLASGHTARQWQSCSLNPGCLALESVLLNNSIAAAELVAIEL